MQPSESTISLAPGQRIDLIVREGDMLTGVQGRIWTCTGVGAKPAARGFGVAVRKGEGFVQRFARHLVVANDGDGVAVFKFTRTGRVSGLVRGSS